MFSEYFELYSKIKHRKKYQNAETPSSQPAVFPLSLNYSNLNLLGSTLALARGARLLLDMTFLVGMGTLFEGNIILRSSFLGWNNILRCRFCLARPCL